MATKAQRRAKRMKARAHQKKMQQRRREFGRKIKEQPDPIGQELLERQRLLSYLDRSGFSDVAQMADQMILLGYKADDFDAVDRLAATIKANPGDIVALGPKSFPSDHEFALAGDERAFVSNQTVLDEVTDRVEEGDVPEAEPIEPASEERELAMIESLAEDSTDGPVREGSGPDVEPSPGDLDRIPTESEWDDMVALAKSRKKGIAKIATRDWDLIEGADAKNRESWIIPGRLEGL